jgi:hypothetical protein
LNGTTGAITGTPTTKGTFAFTVRATDPLNLFDEQDLFIQISEKPTPPVITTTSLPDGFWEFDPPNKEDNRYSVTLKATGGTGVLTWEVLGPLICFQCLLPSGLNLNGSSGEIAGIPTAVGTSTFTIRVTDTDRQSDSRGFSIKIVNRLRITTDKLPTGFIGEEYNTITHDDGEVSTSFDLDFSGGVSPYTWSVKPSLPDGLSLNKLTGFIRGTPQTTVSDLPLTFEVIDSEGQIASKTLTLTILDDADCCG